MHETEPSISVDRSPSSSRPPTPDSPLANSLHQATATIDDITAALSTFSRAPSPDPPNLLQCCCAREECDHTKAWAAFKAKLEGRLVLSAEVGQALLRKHEAYVRRQESPDKSDRRLRRRSRSQSPDRTSHLHERIAELLKENTVLEKRLNAALINSEVSESATKATERELDDVKANVARLSAHHARSIGLETRLNTAIQEKEDFRQERDSDRQRARAAEARAVAMSEKCAKLQSEVRQVHEELEQQKLYRSELSEEILRDARARLEMIQQSQLGHTIVSEDAEITKVMESLVADNEALKRDTAELQNLLTESREDVRSLREEIEETKVTMSSIPEGHSRVPLMSPPPNRHHHKYSWQSSFGGSGRLSPISLSFAHPASRGGGGGSSSVSSPPFQFPHQRRSPQPQSVGPTPRDGFEPLTPETEVRALPLTPTDSVFTHSNSHTHAHTPTHPHPHGQHLNVEVDGESLRANTPDTPEKPKSGRKPLLLLTQNRGVQTDPWVVSESHEHHPHVVSPSPLPSGYSDLLALTPGTGTDGRSESSSIAADGQSSSSAASTTTIGQVVERVSALFTRLSQADALTLTNRLKRQHLSLAPSSIQHLSTSTIASVLSESSQLRHTFRAVLEDEKWVGTCDRRDLRKLLGLVREMLGEVGVLRGVVNEVVLDPGCARRVSEEAMDPARRAGGDGVDRGRSTARGTQAGLGGWIAPITKLFSAATGTAHSSSTPTSPPIAGSQAAPPDITRRTNDANAILHAPRPRLAPKLGPALAASTTTVNVEFSGAGTGRAVSSTTTAVDADPVRRDAKTPAPAPGSAAGLGLTPSSSASSRAVLGIFAGAPVPRVQDPWVVLPKPAARKRESNGRLNTATIGRGGLRATATGNASNRLSRNVDAVLDAGAGLRRGDGGEHGGGADDGDGAEDFRETLLNRTLRPRGLSDSSIRSTFLKHEGAAATSPTTTTGNAPPHVPPGRQGAYYARPTVFQALSRTVANIRSGTPGTSPPSSSTSSMPVPERMGSPRMIEFLPSLNIASWAAAGAGMEAAMAEEFVGSVGDESHMRNVNVHGRGWGGRGEVGHGM
ncbi:hypothetical protein BD410DRAFT_780491 [Rickenella mellea]|uniref:Uncharacterized protein n=1 Tax=Rickenella mellea TaxID=50990 RepID=A0A4R5XFN8_9AGAM|nr:hypothetical protein BD410DRAFT_780491 [Rickenella mellea]